MIRKIGILTSGGDAPGMNAAIASVARCAAAQGIQLMGIKRGYSGLMGLSDNPLDDIAALDLETVLDITDLGGTYLRSARCVAFKEASVREEAAKHLRELGIDALVVVGGDGSFTGAMRLCELGIPCVGIPGTVDNDLAYTERTLGFDTCLNVCVDAVRSIRATSRSHDRRGVVQVMGRYCGDVALHTAMATGAEMVVVPEVEWSIEEVANRFTELTKKGNLRATLIISEHCWGNMKEKDTWRDYAKQFNSNVDEKTEINAEILASILEHMTGYETRATVLGYTQRGNAPTAFDGIYAFEAGRLAVDLISRGITNQAIGMRDGRVFHMPIAEALQMKRHFDRDTYNLINNL